MADTKELLIQIRKDLEGIIGRRVRIKANKGRRRIVIREGTLERTYPNLFVVQLDPEQHNRRVSFTYTDILTGTVELSVIEETGSEKMAYSAG